MNNKNIFGVWKTMSNEGFNMVSGAVVAINDNGSGKLQMWGFGENGQYNEFIDFTYKYQGENTIIINDSIESVQIKYALEPHVDAYGIEYESLYEVNHLAESVASGERGFWLVFRRLVRGTLN